MRPRTSWPGRMRGICSERQGRGLSSSSSAHWPRLMSMRDGQGGVGKVRLPEAAGEVAIDIVLGVEPPARLAVDVGQVLLHPEHLRQRIVHVQPVAGEAVEILRGNDGGDLLHLLFRTRVGVDDVGREGVAVRVHGQAAVHVAGKAHAGHAARAHLLQELADAGIDVFENDVAILLRPVVVGVFGAVGAAHCAHSLALRVEQAALEARRSRVTGKDEVSFLLHAIPPLNVCLRCAHAPPPRRRWTTAPSPASAPRRPAYSR